MSPVLKDSTVIEICKTLGFKEKVQYIFDAVSNVTMIGKMLKQLNKHWMKMIIETIQSFSVLIAISKQLSGDIQVEEIADKIQMKYFNQKFIPVVL